MVKYKESALDDIFSALSDGTRRGIVHRLSSGPARVTELAEPFSMSLPAISKHLKVLERAGLISREKKGREYHLELEPAPMQKAMEFFQFYQSFWQDNFDGLEKFLENKQSQPKQK